MSDNDNVNTPKPRRKRRWLWYCGIGMLVLVIWQVVAWLTPVPAPLASAAAVTDKVYEAVYDESIKKRAAELPADVNILIVGLDNRLASNDNHADAIHLVCIHTKDSVRATVISIPRGTEARGYGIADDLAFMANVRALRGRKTFAKAVTRLTGRKVDYYIEVTFSQVMGVLELLGYKDPATALQFLRHRKSYPLGDVQRSYNQGKFIRTQIVRRADLLTGAKGDLMIRMGLGMVDTDLDFETAQALVYVLRDGNALNTARITQEMRPRMNLARLDSTQTPEPDQMAEAVSRLVRRTGDQIDDLGRYNPYPRLNTIVQRAEAQTQDRATLAVIEPVYEQKAWLQVQERPQRRELRDRVEALLVRAYTSLKKPEKAAAVKKYMQEERQAFNDVETEVRRFAYGRRAGVHKKEPMLDPVAAARAKEDNIHQKQTHVEPQEPTSPAVNPTDTEHGQTAAAPNETPKENGSKPENAPAQEPKTQDLKAVDPKTQEPTSQETKAPESKIVTPEVRNQPTATKPAQEKPKPSTSPATKSVTSKPAGTKPKGTVHSVSKSGSTKPAGTKPAAKPAASKRTSDNSVPHVYDLNGKAKNGSHP